MPPKKNPSGSSSLRLHNNTEYLIKQFAVAAFLLVSVAEAGLHGGATSYANGNLVSLGGYGGGYGGGFGGGYGHHGGVYAVGGGYGGEYGGHYDHYVSNSRKAIEKHFSSFA